MINDVRGPDGPSSRRASNERAEGGEEARELGRTLIGFAHALRIHLRGGGTLAEVPGFAGDPRCPAHVPAFLAQAVYDRIARWRAAGRIDGFALRSLPDLARGLMDVCGACERTRNPPLPYSYRALLPHGTLLFSALAPIYTVRAYGPWGLPVLALVFYFVVEVEMVAEDVEDPFGHHGDDLSLDAYCKVVEPSVAELLWADSGEEPEARAAAEGMNAPYGPSRPPEPMAANAS